MAWKRKAPAKAKAKAKAKPKQAAKPKAPPPIVISEATRYGEIPEAKPGERLVIMKENQSGVHFVRRARSVVAVPNKEAKALIDANIASPYEQ